MPWNPARLASKVLPEGGKKYRFSPLTPRPPSSEKTGDRGPQVFFRAEIFTIGTGAVDFFLWLRHNEQCNISGLASGTEPPEPARRCPSLAFLGGSLITWKDGTCLRKSRSKAKTMKLRPVTSFVSYYGIFTPKITYVYLSPPEGPK